MSLWLVPVVLTGAVVVPPPGRSDQARAVVERAIAAHGGAAAIDRYPAGEDTIKGILVIDGKDVPISGTILFALPGHNKSVITIDRGGMKESLVQIINGDRVSVVVDGQQAELSNEELMDLRHAQFASDIFRLTLLLRDPNITLTSLGEHQFGNRTLIGVLVRHKKQRDVKVWFDQQTGLVARMQRTTVEDGQDKPKVLLYSDYRTFGGVTMPCREVIVLDGHKTQDILTTDRKPLEQVPTKEFVIGN